MEGVLSGACVQLCDPSPEVASLACKALLATLPPPPQPLLSAPVQFEQLLAPVLARLSERPTPCFNLLEDVLQLLLVLLERGDPAQIPTNRLPRVFALVCERLLAVLEELLCKTSTRLAAQAEDLILQVLRASQLLIARWYRPDSDNETSRMQFGYLAHLAVQLLNAGVSSKSAPSRDQLLASVSLLHAMADIPAAGDMLANFYPGVCTALVKLLLQAGKEFKVGFKIVVLGCGCLGAWMRAVLGNGVNAELRARQTPLTLAELFCQHNQRERGAEVTDPGMETRPAVAEPSTNCPLPKLKRDLAWQKETGRQSSDALIAVLRQAEVAAETLWAQKSSVRRGFLDLCITVLQHCDSAVTSEAVEACFEVVLAGLSDESEEAKDAATRYMLELLLDKFGDEQSEKVRHRIVEWLVRGARDIHAASSRIEAARHLPKRLARLEGLLVFVETAARRAEHFSWQAIPPGRVSHLLEPVLQVCCLEAAGLQNLLRDERSLTSVPGSSVSHAERLVKLFPYELQDTCKDQEEDVGLDVKDVCGQPADCNQVRTWLLRALKLPGGDVGLARQLQIVVGRLGRVAGVEAVMTWIFEDEESAWGLEAQAWNEPFPLSPPDASKSASKSGCSGSALQRRNAAMFALAAFLEAACEVQESTPPALPSWLALHCLCIGLTGRSRAVGGTSAEVRCLGRLSDPGVISQLSSRPG